jgi:hypothetical protein
MIQNPQELKEISDLKLENTDLQFFVKEHTDFINGCLDLIRRGKMPKHSHKTIINNLCKAHGFVLFTFPDSTEPFFIRQSNLERFQKLCEKAVENNNNPPINDSNADSDAHGGRQL